MSNFSRRAAFPLSEVGQGDTLHLYFGKNGEGPSGSVCGPGNYPTTKGEDMFSSSKVTSGETC